MKTMTTFYLDNQPNSRTLIQHQAPIPSPAPNEILIRIHAAGVTPSELQWYPTTHTKSGTPRANVVPSHELSGVIEALGEKVANFKVGQEVFGMNDWFADGATAEYCLTDPTSIALKPGKLTHIEAASVPIGALTAWQGLLVRANLKRGERALIHGGSGAVGLFAIQLAHQAGAHVITTASTKHAEYLRDLGADQIIDYERQQFETLLSDIDVVFDGVGGTTLTRSWTVLKPGGRLVTIAADSEATQDARTKAAFFIVEPNQQQLIEIAALLDSGKLKPCVDNIVPLTQASSAYDGTLQRHTGRGKVVIQC